MSEGKISELDERNLKEGEQQLTATFSPGWKTKAIRKFIILQSEHANENEPNRTVNLKPFAVRFLHGDSSALPLHSFTSFFYSLLKHKTQHSGLFMRFEMLPSYSKNEQQ